MSDDNNPEVEALKAEVERLKAAQGAPPPAQSMQPTPPASGGGAGGIVAPLVALAVIVAAAIGVYYLGSPYLAFNALRMAAKNGDRDRLERLVDFPVLRANLKSELSAKMVKAIQEDSSNDDSGYAALGAAFGSAVIDKLVDAYVTPDTIQSMVDTGKAPAPASGAAPAPQTAGGTKLKSQMGYADLDHFRTKLFDAADPKNQVTLVMERRSLFAWKLVRIDFDVDRATQSAKANASAQADSNAAAAAASGAAAEAVAAASDAQAAQDAAAKAETAAAPQPVRHAVRRGPAPGTDAYACAHGDHSNADVIEACDRAQIRANGGGE